MALCSNVQYLARLISDLSLNLSINMGKKCCAPNCRSGYSSCETKFRIHVFPKNEELRQKWVRAVPRKDLIVTENMGVCEKHFHAHWTFHVPEFDFVSNIFSRIQYRLQFVSTIKLFKCILIHLFV